MTGVKFRKGFFSAIGSAMGMDILAYADEMEDKLGEEGRKKKRSWFEKKPQSEKDDVKKKMDAYKRREKRPAAKRDYGYYERGRRKETYMDAETAKSKATAAAAPVCQYCNSRGYIKTAKEYKGRADDYCYWVCPTCTDVCVTTIKGGFYASGEMANADLRKLRSLTHQQIAFKKDELHQNHIELQNWIAAVLALNKEEAKIGVMSESQLNELVEGANHEYYQKHYAHIFEKNSEKGD